MAVTAAELNVKINSTLNEQGFDRAERRVDGLGKRLTTVIGTAGGVLLAGAVNQVAQNIGGLVSAGLDFEAQMANVNSIAQLSATELQNLSDQVLALTSNPGITDGPAALAAGLYNIASSGFTGADGLAILEASALAASAGLTTTETAATAITAALNAYGLEASSAADISDMMFQTVNEGVLTFDQLASNLGGVLPIAASLGVGFDQLGAAYAQITLSGSSASEAQTQIAALMRSALNPTEQLTAAVQEHGFASAAAAIESEGMAGFLKILTEESGGSQEALFDMLGTTEALQAALTLGGDGLDEYIASIERMGEATEGAGATQKALQKQMQSASFQLAKAKQQVQVAATMFMGLLAPGISAAAQALTGFISGGVIPFIDVIGQALRGGFDFRDAIDALPEPLQRTAGALGSLFEAAGDVVRAFDERGLAGAIRTLTEGGELDQIGAAFSAIGQEAWNALVAGFQAIPWGTIWDMVVKPLLIGAAELTIDAGTWAITVGAPRLAGWIFDQAGNLWEWLKGKMGLTGGTVGDGTGGPESDRQPMSLTDWVLDVAAPKITGWIADAAADAWPHIKSAANWAGVQLYNFGAWALQTAAPTIAGWLNDNKDEAWNALKTAAGWAGEQLMEFGAWTLNVAAPAVGGWLADIGGNLWGWLQAQMGIGGGIAGPGAVGGGAGGGGGTTGADALGLSGVISGAIAGGLQAASNVVVELLNGFSDDVDGWKTEITDTITGIADIIIPDIKIPTPTFDTSGILGAVDTVVEFIEDQIDRIQDAYDRLAFWQNDESRGTPRQTNGQDFGGTNTQSSSQPGALASGEVVTSLPRVGSGTAAPMVIPAPDISLFTSVMASIPQIVGTNMSAALSAASTYASAIGSVVGSQIGAMVGNVTALMGAFTVAVGQGMSNSLSAASVYSGAIVSAVSAALGQLPGIAAAATAPIPGIIAGNLAAAAGAAYSSGVAIGQGLAAGMNAMLGAVQAAAAALASAAAQAASARLQIASPSKVFTRMGEQVGDGFVIGIQSRYGAAGRAGEGLAGSSIPSSAAAASGRRGASGPTIQVFALKSDELVRLIEKAERGGAFAEQLPQILRQGAY